MRYPDVPMTLNVVIPNHLCSDIIFNMVIIAGIFMSWL